MILKFKFLIFFALITLSSTFAKNFKVINISEYKEKVKFALPGDSIVLANGVWKDVQLVFKGDGKEGSYIYLTAETPGKVTLEGKSYLTISGNWLHISGLVFVNGYTPKKTVIEFRTSSKDYAYNTVLSNCVIDKYNQVSKDSADHWLGVWGKKNTIEYCYFGGKKNAGTTLVVWPNDSNSTNNNHLIYRNYFGPRPRLGVNGGETIRIGTSQVCHLSSGSIVDGNYFERCNGEVEIISNKSGDNKYVNNTFFECEGNLVLRHGNRALVSGNWFLGNGRENTGGVRVINEGHQIYNNYFYKLRGTDTRSPLVIMNAIPDSPANGYAPVKNIIIANNTFNDCTLPWGFGVGFGERNRIVKPENTLLLNNLVYCPAETELIKYYDNTDGVKLDNNLMINNKGALTDTGTVTGEIQKAKIWDIDYVYSTVKAKKLPFVKYDILGQTRGVAVIGAFQNAGEKTEVELATAKNCGPAWYKSTLNKPVKPKTEPKQILVSAGTDNLSQALKKANEGDIFLLESGEHIITKKLIISKDLTIRAAKDAIAKPILKYSTEKENGSIFELSGKAVLRLEGIAVNGDSKAKFPAKYIFISSKEGANGYSLFINNCEIYDVNVEGGAIFKAYKSTMADSIKVTNSILRDSYRAFSLGEEKDDIGKYSAELVQFDNTVFSNFAQYIVDFYRGGNDESSLGGTFNVNHCVFDNVGQDEKQYIFKLTRIVKVSIANSIFNNSAAKISFKLAGGKNTISSCCMNGCTSPKIEGGAISSNILSDSPGFEKKSFVLSKKSKLIGKATDGGNIGLR